MNPQHLTDFRYQWPVGVLVVVLAMLLVLPALFGFRHNEELTREHQENRRMTALPNWTLYREKPRRYLEHMQAFLNDWVGFKRQANTFYRRLRFTLLNDPPFENITIGKDGFIFMNSHRLDRPHLVFNLLCEQQGHPTPALIDSMDTTFAAVSHYYQSKGAKVTITAAPTSLAVYPDKLPPSVETRYRNDCQAYPTADSLLKKLQRMGKTDRRYSLFYPLELFIQHRDEPYFYPKETFHWSGRSAFLFARYLLAESGVTDRPYLQEPTVIGKVGDDLGMFFGFNRQIYGLKYPYASFHTTGMRASWSKDIYKNGNILYFHTPHPLAKKRGLLISNSFGIELAPHLAKGFEHFFFFNINSLMREEEKRAFAQVADLAQPEYVYILFDDAGIIAAPKRLKAIVELDRALGRHPGS